jgi:MFS family permease
MQAAPPLPPPSFWQRYTIALHYRDFVWIWLGSLGGQSAYWALIVARGVLVLDMSNSSALVGITTFAAMFPRVIFPALAGYAADRFNRRTVLAISYALQLAHAIVLTILAFTGVLEIWHIIILSFLNGSFRTFQMTTTQALIPNLVPREHWLNALALNQVTTQGSRLVGPAIVVPALLLIGPNAAFLASSTFYLLGVIGILMVRTRSSGGLQKGASIGASLLEAARFAWSHPQIRSLFILVALHCSMTMAFESTFPVFSRDVLGGGRAGVSFLMMGVGSGALITVIYIAGVRSALARGRLLFILGLTSGLSMVALAMTTTMVMSLIAAAVMGASQAGFMACSGAMVQSLAPDDMRGRISGLNQINVGGTMAMVNLVNGFAADAYGAPPLLMSLGIGFSVVVVGSLFLTTARSFYAGAIPLPVRASS